MASNSKTDQPGLTSKSLDAASNVAKLETDTFVATSTALQPGKPQLFVPNKSTTSRKKNQDISGIDKLKKTSLSHQTSEYEFALAGNTAKNRIAASTSMTEWLPPRCKVKLMLVRNATSNGLASRNNVNSDVMSDPSPMPQSSPMIPTQLFAFSPEHEEALLTSLLQSNVRVAIRRLYKLEYPPSERVAPKNTRLSGGRQQKISPSQRRSRTRRYRRSTPLKTFKIFSKLPAELRLIVWKFAVPGPRTLKLRIGDSLAIFRTTEKVPSILHTNQESRKVGLSFLKQRFFPLYMDKSYGIYTDVEIDTILVDLRTATRMTTLRDVRMNEDRGAVRHVAIPFEFTDDPLLCRSLSALVCRAPSGAWPSVTSWSFPGINLNVLSTVTLQIERPDSPESAMRMTTNVEAKFKAALEEMKAKNGGVMLGGLKVTYLMKNSKD